MRRFARCIPLLALALASCRPLAPAAPAASQALATTQSPAPTPTSTSPPPTPRPAAEPVSFFRLRVELSTTSDWTTLALLASQPILTARLAGTEGDPTYAYAGIPNLDIGQPLGAAEAGARVGLTADFALKASADLAGLGFRLEKGDVGTVVIRVSVLSAGETILLEEVRHGGTVPGSAGRNPLVFEVDLMPLLGLEAELGAVGGGRFPRQLWAFYYPWYTRADWSSPWLRDVPLEPYRSSDRTATQRHVRQAKGAGIDGFISSWWGPGDPTDANLRTLLDVAQEEDFLVTIYFETLTGEGPLPPAEIERWLTYVIESYGDHPAFARVDGRPVIVVWASETVPIETWREILDRVRRSGLDAFYLSMGYTVSNLEVFDGLHEYGVFALPDLERTVASTGSAVRSYSLLQEAYAPKLWAATVQPGYDDRLLPDREGGTVQPRDDGAFYRRTWEAALASDPDWVLITTWNEWWEHTHIEPSREFGALYLDITRDFAAAWKKQ